MSQSDESDDESDDARANALKEDMFNNRVLYSNPVSHHPLVLDTAELD